MTKHVERRRLPRGISRPTYVGEKCRLVKFYSLLPHSSFQSKFVANVVVSEFGVNPSVEPKRKVMDKTFSREFGNIA
jgi:hypothetical protein